MQTLCDKMLKRSRHFLLTCATLMALLSAACCSKVDELPKNIDDPRIGTEKGTLHIVTTSQCNKGYLTYQAWAQKYSLEMVNQPGKFTRVMSCDHPENLEEEDLSYMDTMVVPDWGTHPRTGDDYSPFNRPVGLIYWLAERRPTAEWTLILDPDMLIRQPFLLKDFEVPEGYAMAARYDYLHAVSNGLPDLHIPHVLPRQDEYGGPKGRKADMAGAFYLIRTKDLVKLAPLWLKYTEDLREDSRTINYTGVPEQVGEKEWVSEMYAYDFAAAAVGVWHKLETETTYYPDYAPADFPIVMHYGQNHSLIGDNYYFVKYDHLDFDHARCPPWNMSFHRDPKDDGGLFPHPPFPDVIPDLPPREKYGKLLIIEVGNTLNQALCTRHRRQCPPSVQLEIECGRVDAIAAALKVEFDKLHVPGVICHDNSDQCMQMAEKGYCETKWMYMIENCRASCNRCRTYIPRRNEMSPINNVVHEAKTEDLEKHSQVSKSKELESAEILRCQSSNLKSFLADSTCRRLARDGVISLGWMQQTETTSFKRSTQLLEGSQTDNLYSAIIFAFGLFSLMLLAKRYLVISKKKALRRLK